MSQAGVCIELNEQQYRATTDLSGVYVVCAGAGSGKTRVITARILTLLAQHHVPPSSVLALTFTNKAAREMLDRVTSQLTAMGICDTCPFIGTFHSYCLALLRRHNSMISVPSFSILDEDDQERLLKKIIDTYTLTKRVAPRTILSNLSLIKNGLVHGTVQQAVAAIGDPLVRDIMVQYEREKTACRCYDFDDLLIEALALLRKNPAIKLMHQQTVRHLLIDEYQDTNKLQHALVQEMVLDHARVFSIDSVCVVGDEDQSIYSWRGATIDNIMNVSVDLGGAQHVTIDQNYRSVQPILSCANALIQHNNVRNPKHLWSELVGQDRVRVVEAFSGMQEADLIALCSRMYRRVHARSTIAVLYRSHYQSRQIEEALIREAIPYTIVGGIQFYKRQEIKDLIAYAKVAVNPFDKLSFSRVLNTPARGLGEKTEQAIMLAWEQHPFLSCVELIRVLDQEDVLVKSKKTALNEFAALITKIGAHQRPIELFETVVTAIDYFSYLDDSFEKGEAESKKQNVREFLGSLQIRDFAETTVAQFLEHVALVEEQSSRRAESAEQHVKLMTFHAAKGLEFDCVIISGLEEQIMPSSRALYSPASLEEERRLLYVGITRAKEHVLLLHSESRFLFGTVTSQQPSRFLDEIPQALASRAEARFWTLADREQFFSSWFGPTRSVTARSGTSRSGATRPETSRLTTTQSETIRSETNSSKTAGSGANWSKDTRAETNRSKTARAGTRGSGVTGHGVIEPVATGPCSRHVPALQRKTGTGSSQFHAGQPASGGSIKKLDAVKHPTFGLGVVEQVELRADGSTRLVVKFGKSVKKIDGHFVEKI